MMVKVMQIADLPAHASPWVDGMDARLPAGAAVYATECPGYRTLRVARTDDPAVVGLSGDALLRAMTVDGWYVHHTSLIPLTCGPARPRG